MICAIAAYGSRPFSEGDATTMSQQGSEALNRTFQELKSKSQDARLKASYDLYSLITLAARGDLDQGPLLANIADSARICQPKGSRTFMEMSTGCRFKRSQREDWRNPRCRGLDKI